MGGEFKFRVWEDPSVLPQELNQSLATAANAMATRAEKDPRQSLGVGEGVQSVLGIIFNLSTASTRFNIKDSASTSG